MLRARKRALVSFSQEQSWLGLLSEMDTLISCSTMWRENAAPQLPRHSHRSFSNPVTIDFDWCADIRELTANDVAVSSPSICVMGMAGDCGCFNWCTSDYDQLQVIFFFFLLFFRSSGGSCNPC